MKASSSCKTVDGLLVGADAIGVIVLLSFGSDEREEERVLMDDDEPKEPGVSLPFFILILFYFYFYFYFFFGSWRADSLALSLSFSSSITMSFLLLAFFSGSDQLVLLFSGETSECVVVCFFLFFYFFFFNGTDFSSDGQPDILSSSIRLNKVEASCDDDFFMAATIVRLFLRFTLVPTSYLLLSNSTVLHANQELGTRKEGGAPEGAFTQGAVRMVKEEKEREVEEEKEEAVAGGREGKEKEKMDGKGERGGEKVAFNAFTIYWYSLPSLKHILKTPTSCVCARECE